MDKGEKKERNKGEKEERDKAPFFKAQGGYSLTMRLQTI